MDWTRASAWMYLNSVPDYGKLARYRIGTVYIDPRSTNAATVIKDLVAHGIQAGIYEVPQWPTRSMDPLTFATQVKADLVRLIPQAYPLPTQKQGAPVMHDLEGVTFEWIATFAAAMHRLAPARETAFTTEPYKYGTDFPYPQLAALDWHYYVQSYDANMNPVNDLAWLTLPVTRGYPPDHVHVFYDGARPPARATDGCLFTLERTP